ncbi:hypothetical protein B0919_01880 [Hymenobacter sp. CRA2]|nr:hypothetical protein B0919_01880 [Hymenobacter sp. CRA2]
MAAVVGALICIVLLYLAAREARAVLARRTEGVHLTGTVAQRRAILPPTPKGKRPSAPKPGSVPVEYTVVTTYQGQPVQVVNEFRHTNVDYAVGSRVPVVYVPSHPKYSRIASTTEQYGHLLQLLGFAVLSGVTAALLWLRRVTTEAVLRTSPSADAAL